jgi:hypothetical protein
VVLHSGRAVERIDSVEFIVRRFLKFFKEQMVGLAMVLEADFTPIADRIGIGRQHLEEVSFGNVVVLSGSSGLILRWRKNPCITAPFAVGDNPHSLFVCAAQLLVSVPNGDWLLW